MAIHEICDTLKANIMYIHHFTFAPPPRLRPPPIQTSSSSSSNQWAQQWKKAAQKVLSLPDASQVRIKFEVVYVYFMWIYRNLFLE